MNRIHRCICRSDHWKKQLENQILPWTLTAVQLGEDVLEIGPGPGLTTEILSRTISHLTAVELDDRLARRAWQRLDGRRVRMVRGDGTALPFASGCFSGVVCFTMLHHVSSAGLQNKLLAEAARVLQPGGVFAGVDSVGGLRMRILHLWDTLVPIDPPAFGARLEAAGFADPKIMANGSRFRFSARKL